LTINKWLKVGGGGWRRKSVVMRCIQCRC